MNKVSTSTPKKAPSARKSGWSARSKVADLDRTEDEDGDTVLWSGMVEDRECAYLLQPNPAWEEGTKQPHHHLIQFTLDEYGTWGDEILICSLWKSEAANGGAEPETYTSGTNRSKTAKYSVWKDRELSDGKKGHTLYEQLPIEKTGQKRKDDFID